MNKSLSSHEMRNAIVMVAGAATLTCIDPDGEIQWAEGLNVGRYPLSDWLPFMAEGSELEVSGAASILIQTPRVYRVRYGEGSHASGANPEFVVTSASRNEREMQRTLRMLTTKSETLDRKLAAMETLRESRVELVEREGLGPKPDAVEVPQGDHTDPDETAQPAKE